MGATLPDAPTTALGAGPGFVVELEAFSGPLDLLLHLLREEQIEIADIPISRIADQFLQAIHELGLNQAADYLDMASRLVRLKAQMLLPRRAEDDEWEDPRAELVRRLLEYQQIREIAVWMGRAAERRAEQLAARIPAAGSRDPTTTAGSRSAAMLQAVERVIAAIPSPVLHRVVARPLDVEGAISRIERLLEEREEFGWIEALGTASHDRRGPLHSAGAARARQARLAPIVQSAAFAPMVIARDAARPAA